MKTTSKLSYLTLLVFVSLALVGCGTTTTVRLTGTPDTQVSGHYRAGHVSSDFAGTAAWQMNFDRQHLEDFEFRKATIGHSVDLDIRQGRMLLVHATAEAGVLGLRVRSEDGWRVETLK